MGGKADNNLQIVDKNYLKERGKEKYIGMTRTMNCGIKATVLEYNNCHDMTIQFEDGLIKYGVKMDKFKSGKVGHKC